MLLNNLCTGFATKHAVPCQHVVEHCCQGIDISVGIPGLSKQLFWCGSTELVHTDSAHCFRIIQHRQLEHAFYAKIRDEQRTILFDENILDTQTAMEYGSLMGVGKPSGDLIQIAANK